MVPLKIICILLILVGPGQGEDIFFADDHYKSSGEILLYASAINPALVPGDCVLEVGLANLGRIDELIPVSRGGSADDVLREIKEEMNSSLALEIETVLNSIGPVQVTSGPQYLSALPAGEAKELQFNVSIDRRASGWYDLPLRVDYVQQVDVSVSDGQAFPLRQPSNQSLNLRIYVSGNEADLRIAGMQSDLHPGKAGTLTVALENMGEDILPDTSASLLVAPPFRVKSPDHILGDLAPEEIALASFLVEVDGNASQEEYQLGLRLRSQDTDMTLPFPLSLKESKGLLSHSTSPFIFLLALIALLALAATVLRRQKLLYGRKRRIKRL